MSTRNIPLHRPFAGGKELEYIAGVIASRQLAGGGAFAARCQRWIEERIGCPKALLTHSCTAALEMAAMLIGLRPGDEVIVPSFTFPSTANALVLRGAVPVFVDIRPDTLNLDERKVRAAITPLTRAIVVVHYGGVACEMDEISRIAAEHALIVIEDAAHGLLSTYRGRPLGGIGHLAALSFHGTKNIVSGEGGALLVNDGRFIEPAQIIRDKGTNRQAFLSGVVDSYSWVGAGSSYAPNEITAAFLYAQFEQAGAIQAARSDIWHLYQQMLAEAADEGLMQLPCVPSHVQSNWHIFHVLLKQAVSRVSVLQQLGQAGIGAASHYNPLDQSPAGIRFGRVPQELTVTRDISGRLIRLPLWVGMSEEDVRYVVTELVRAARASELPHPRTGHG